MPMTYLAHYQIGQLKPDREFRVPEFLTTARENAKKLDDDVHGIELRINGRITKHGNVVEGPNPDEIHKVCEFVDSHFKTAYFHLSPFGLDILQRKHKGRKVDEVILDTFDKFIGHYKEHESLFGQVLRQKDWQIFTKSRAGAKKAFRSYIKYLLDDDALLTPQDRLLVENGYFARNSLTEVYKYATRRGMCTAIDIGHIHRELFDPVAGLGGVLTTEGDPNKFLRDNGTFKSNYLEDIGKQANHLHFHWMRKDKDEKTSAMRVKDHLVFNSENTRTFTSGEQAYILGLTERILKGAQYAGTCTLELNKKVNTPQNIHETIDNLIGTFGQRFNPA